MASHAPVHSVHIYNEDSALISRLCSIARSSLETGDAVLIVATAPHREQLVAGLEKSGVEVRGPARDGLFTMIDAKAALSSFMVKGAPDRQRFMTSIGSILDNARKAARSRDRGLTVFGEMVAVLWDEGNKQAALELEALWNDALNDRTFHLHC